MADDGIKITYDSIEYDIYGDVTYETKGNIKRLNQKKYQTLDGGTVVFDNGINFGYSTIKLDNVTQSDYEILRELILEELNFAEQAFDIVPLLTEVDIGNGAGVTIEDAHLSNSEFGDMFVLSPPGTWTITLQIEYSL